eukprot:scaffold199094_cov18-Tisochrysis_lutea.AAC.2
MLALCTHLLHAQIDQAALTGESLPAKKFTGDVAFSGSSIKQGERHAVVYATGVNTFFGRAAALISGTNNVSNLQVCNWGVQIGSAPYRALVRRARERESCGAHLQIG